MAHGRHPNREWSDGLPVQLLGVILLLLPCFADRVCFAAVCRAWRSVAWGVAPPRQLPWLVFPSLDVSSFTLESGATRRLNLPGVRVIPPFNLRGGGGTIPEHPILIRNVTFSAAPTTVDCLAAAHITCGCNIAFWRPGMDAHWLAYRHPSIVMQDIIYCRSLVGQGFHVITDAEDLLVYTANPRGRNAPLEMTRVPYRFEKRADFSLNQPEYSVTRCLVASQGKLLMVLREYSLGRGVARRTWAFRIFEIELEISALGNVAKACWVEVRELHGQALFLGRGCSRAFEVSQYAGLQDGFIYFLDDTCFDILSILSSGGKCQGSDMGMYAMRKVKDGAQRFPNKFASDCSPPGWCLH